MTARAQIVRRTAGKGDLAWLEAVRVSCPICGRTHVHGRALVEPLPITRKAGCDRSHEYEIYEAPDFFAPKTRGAA